MRSRTVATLVARTKNNDAEEAEAARKAGKSSLTDALTKILIGNVGMIGLSVLTGVITARQLATEGRGEVAAVLSLILYISLAGSFGNWTGLSRIEATQPEKSDQAVGAALIAIAILGTLTVAFAQIILPVLFWEQTDQLLASARKLVFFIYPVMLFQASNDLLVGRQRFGRVSFDRFVRPLYHLIGVVGLALTDNITVTNVLVVIGISHGIVGVLSFGSLIRESGIKKPEREILHDSYHFGIRIFGGVIAQKSNHELDLMIMPALVAPEIIGIYVIAVSTAAIITGGFSHLRSLVFGIVSRNAGKAEEDSIRLIEFTGRLTLLGATVASAGLFVLAPFLVEMAYGEEFADSANVLRYLLPGVVALVFAEVIFGALASMGKPLWATWASLVGLLFTIVGIFLTVKPYGARGAAGTTTVAYTAMMISTLYLASKVGISPRRLFSLKLLRQDLAELKSAALAKLNPVPTHEDIAAEPEPVGSNHY